MLTETGRSSDKDLEMNKVILATLRLTFRGFNISGVFIRR